MNSVPRDLRHDLRERLASIDARYADVMVSFDERREALFREYRETILELDRERAAVEQLLTIEESRHGALSAEIAIKRAVRRVPLSDFLVTKAHAHGPLEKDQLRAEAKLAGYFEEVDGRTFHTTLMNITNGGRLRRLSDGRYAFPERPAVFETGDMMLGL